MFVPRIPATVPCALVLWDARVYRRRKLKVKPQVTFKALSREEVLLRSEHKLTREGSLSKCGRLAPCVFVFERVSMAGASGFFYGSSSTCLGM